MGHYWHIDTNNYKPERTFQKAMDEINKSCSDEEKRFIFLELIAIVLADEKYKDSEKNLIEKLMYGFEISEKVCEEAFDIIKDIYS